MTGESCNPLAPPIEMSNVTGIKTIQLALITKDFTRILSFVATFQEVIVLTYLFIMATPLGHLWSHNWEDKTLIINGRKVQLLKQLSDRYAHPFGQRVAVVMGKDDASGDSVVLKMRYEFVSQLNFLNFKLPLTSKP